MNDILKNTLMKYGVVFSKRYSRKQKSMFLNEVIEEISAKNKPIDIVKRKDFFKTNISCAMGDLENADKILVAAYDTPAKVYFGSSNYYPFNIKMNMKNEKKILLYQLVIFIVLSTPFLFYIMNLNSMMQLNKIVFGFLTIGLLIVATKTLSGFANKINMNRNSASVSVLIELAKLEYKNKIAFILVDNGISSFWGFKEMAKIIKKETKVILLDSLASGDQLVCVHKKNTNVNQIVDNKTVNFHEKVFDLKETNTVLDIFDRTIYIGSGSLKNNQFIIMGSGTNEDYHVDVERLKRIKEILRDYLED